MLGFNCDFVLMSPEFELLGGVKIPPVVAQVDFWYCTLEVGRNNPSFLYT